MGRVLRDQPTRQAAAAHRGNPDSRWQRAPIRGSGVSPMRRSGAGGTMVARWRRMSGNHAHLWRRLRADRADRTRTVRGRVVFAVAAGALLVASCGPVRDGALTRGPGGAAVPVPQSGLATPGAGPRPAPTGGAATAAGGAAAQAETLAISGAWARAAALPADGSAANSA